MNLKNRLAALEALARSIKKILPVRCFVLDGTDAQQQEIARLKAQGVKIRAFHVVE